MSKRKLGHAENSKLNGEWGAHVKKWMKKITSGRRRSKSKKLIREGLVDSQLEKPCDYPG